MTRRLLVTTAIEQTWGNGEPILYAGEWCRLYDRREAWGAREHRVLDYHWSDRAKLLRDHRYLDELQESLLVHLTDALNGYHGIERPLRYWRMVLGVWLPTYVAALFDRWECLRLAFEGEGVLDTIALPSPEPWEPPRDSDAFVNLAAYSAEWNHYLYLAIIAAAHRDRCVVRSADAVSARPASRAAAVPGERGPWLRLSKAAVRSLVRNADALAARLTRRYQVVFFCSYFPPAALVRLNLALGQVPRLHLAEFAERPPEGGTTGPAAGNKSRMALRISREPRSEFEAFLTNRIAGDLPVAHVEDFPRLLERVSRLRLSARVICSAGAHWNNEPFKLWCAEQVLAGSKFVALTHGGSIPLLIDQTMCFEEKISDCKITWSIPYRANHVRLPPSKLVGTRTRSSRTICSVITQETPLFPYRASDGPIGVGVLEIVPLVCRLYAGLLPQIQQCFRVKPYRDLGWNTRQRFSDALGARCIYGGTSYRRCLSESRIAISTYPETTFAEAMASGLPTLLVYPAHLWETMPQMDSLLGRLRAARIVHDDPARAAAHVNAIWEDPETWWESAEVAAARTQFFADCLDLDPHWIRKWTNFLREAAA